MAQPRVSLGTLPRKTVEEIDKFRKSLNDKMNNPSLEIKRPAAIHIAIVNANNKINSPFTIVDPSIKNLFSKKKVKRFE